MGRSPWPLVNPAIEQNSPPAALAESPLAGSELGRRVTGASANGRAGSGVFPQLEQLPAKHLASVDGCVVGLSGRELELG